MTKANSSTRSLRKAGGSYITQGEEHSTKQRTPFSSFTFRTDLPQRASAATTTTTATGRAETESRQASSALFDRSHRDFVIKMPPSPAPLARWRHAQAVTRAVRLVSARVFVTGIAAMAIVSLTRGEEWPAVFRDSRGENRPAARASLTAFFVLVYSVGMFSGVSELLSTCMLLSRAKAFGWAPVTLKSPGAIAIVTFAYLLPMAGVLLLALVSPLLEPWSTKGSPMETVGSVIAYAGMGMMALFLAGIAVMECVLVVYVCMEVWQCIQLVKKKH